jgi:hypothetical protein
MTKRYERLQYEPILGINYAPCIAISGRAASAGSQSYIHLITISACSGAPPLPPTLIAASHAICSTHAVPKNCARTARARARRRRSGGGGRRRWGQVRLRRAEKGAPDPLRPGHRRSLAHRGCGRFRAARRIASSDARVPSLWGGRAPEPRPHLALFARPTGLVRGTRARQRACAVRAP